MKVFVKQDDDILLNANYAEAYIPDELFTEIDEDVPKSAIAYMVGHKSMLLVFLYENHGIRRRCPKKYPSSDL